MSEIPRRFSSIARLYGTSALTGFQLSHVMVIGIGGVGSWCAEALARSGVGHLTLVDLDHVAESNINRQVHALDSTLGAAKIDAMAARIREINPECQLTLIEDFVTPENLNQLLIPAPDLVIDAIDQVRVKTALIAWCAAHHQAIITVGAAGGQTDPTQICVNDLSRTIQDPLLSKVRAQLRKHHQFPRGDRKFGVNAVYSTEALRYPTVACDTSSSAPQGLNCAGFGSSVVITATMGLFAAGQALNWLARLK